MKHNLKVTTILILTFLLNCTLTAQYIIKNVKSNLKEVKSPVHLIKNKIIVL